MLCPSKLLTNTRYYTQAFRYYSHQHYSKYKAAPTTMQEGLATAQDLSHIQWRQWGRQKQVGGIDKACHWWRKCQRIKCNKNINNRYKENVAVST